MRAAFPLPGCVTAHTVATSQCQLPTASERRAFFQRSLPLGPRPGATFATIRALGGDALRLLKNRIAVRLLRQLDAQPIASVALLRVLFQTVPALNYALAMSGIKFRTYLIGTLMGLPVPIALYCIFFNILANWLHVS